MTTTPQEPGPDPEAVPSSDPEPSSTPDPDNPNEKATSPEHLEELSGPGQSLGHEHPSDHG